VGLSATDKSLWAKSLLEGGIDVDKFLDTFLGDLFPELEDRPIHFAGESFGGKYVPVYAAMARRRFDSIILVDPFFDPSFHELSVYHHFCPLKGEAEGAEGKRPPRYLNETACAAMETAYGKCEKIGKECSATYDADVCFLAQKACKPVMKWIIAESVPGGRDPYDDRHICDEPVFCNDLGKLIRQVSEAQ
jgi:carboxypeptidase C (cathepsin A)